MLRVNYAKKRFIRLGPGSVIIEKGKKEGDLNFGPVFNIDQDKNLIFLFAPYKQV